MDSLTVNNAQQIAGHPLGRACRTPEHCTGSLIEARRSAVPAVTGGGAYGSGDDGGQGQGCQQRGTAVVSCSVTQPVRPLPWCLLRHQMPPSSSRSSCIIRGGVGLGRWGLLLKMLLNRHIPSLSRYRAQLSTFRSPISPLNRLDGSLLRTPLVVMGHHVCQGRYGAAWVLGCARAVLSMAGHFRRPAADPTARGNGPHRGRWW